MKREDLKKLADPIDNIRWRVQSHKEYQGKCYGIYVAYIDSRDVQERLDSVCGIADWQSRHKEVKGNLFCEIGILVDNEWIWKSDVGSESNISATKGESSDSFKRAAVMWGIGRFLYSIPPIKLVCVKEGKYYFPIVNGQTLKYPNDIVDHCNRVYQERLKKAA